MPYLKPMNDDDEQRKRGLSGYQAGAAAQAVPMTPGAAQPDAPSSVRGSGHINIGDYLRANEGAGKAMADKVAGGIEAKAAQIGGANIGGSKVTAPGAVNGFAQGPRKTGPQMLSGQAELDAAADVERQAKLAATPGGQKELLDKAYGAGRTGGESNLDNALMGAGGGGSRLAELSKKYSGLAGMVRGRNDYNAEQGRQEEDARRIAARPLDLGKVGAGVTAGAGKAASTMGRAVDQTGKRSWADYSKADPLRGVYQAHRAVNPIDWVADLAGVKNPIDGLAAKTFSGGAHDENNNYSNMIDFGAVMPPGRNDAATQEKVYNSMTQAEIEEIGKMSRRDQQAWVMARMEQLGLLAAGPTAPGSSADMTGGAYADSDPNTQSDQELSAMGYMYERAPGESYAHYSDRIAARKGG